MNQHTYTFIGCCSAIEHALAGDPTVAEALQKLSSIRLALLDSQQGNDPDSNLKAALRSHVVPLLEAVETLRKSPKYQALDSTLIELMNHYYNISDAIMGGGGSGSESGSDKQEG